MLGILNGDGYQALFVDTPGVLRPGYKLQEMMKQEIDSALRDADVVLMLVDVERPGAVEVMTEVLAGRNALAAVNKIDKVPSDALLPLIARLSRVVNGKVYLVSALKGSGVEDLKQAVIAALPKSAPFYPKDQVSERPERFFVAELVREAIFNRYGEEIPYSTTVVVQEFREREGRKDYIKATVYVERSSQKAIIIGKDGDALKRVGSMARRGIEQFLGRPVYLELRVKVADDWRRNESFIRDNVYRT